MAPLTAPLGNLRHAPVDQAGLVERLRLTILSAGYAAAMAPALALGILTILIVPLYLPMVGLVLALGVIPATAALTAAHRRVSGALLGVEIPASYRDTSRQNVLVQAVSWMSDPARWRDFGFLWFSATGGFVLSAIPVFLLTTPLVYLIVSLATGDWLWVLCLTLGGPMLLVWWLVTPALVRARAVTERNILGGGRVAQMQQRVERVEETRAESLDHSAREVRRIERDLHDGAQARIAAVGMNVGLAEKLLATDPEAAAALLREARETTVDALEDLRSVVRGILPPVLADRGLVGAVEALAVSLPVPVTVAVTTPRLPAPVESATYFAIAECLANTVKHAHATRAWVRGRYDGTQLTVVVGDDGSGGADADGSGLTGVRNRLAAFDGTVAVDSPDGGPTTIALAVPCAL